MRRSLAVAGLSGALLVGGAAGVLVGNPLLSGAQTDPTTPSTAMPSTTAPDPSSVPGDPGAERTSRLNEILAPLITDGTITQAQADAVIAALTAADPGPGWGKGGHMKFGVLGAGVEAAAEALGITTDELRTAIESGTTLGALADQHGVSRDALVEAIVAPVQERLDAAVADGSLTQAEADARLERIRSEVTSHLDTPLPSGLGRPEGDGWGRRGPDERPAPDAIPTPGATPSTSTTAT